MNSATHTESTALGAFVFTLQCAETSDRPSIEIRVVIPTPRLPFGMTVEVCKAIVARVRSTSAISRMRWSCACERQIGGSPEPGERLDAQGWRLGARLVLVGTEDSEALAARLPFLDVRRDESLITYSPDKMELCLDNIPPDVDLSLHFVIAENPWPEPEHASAWYAVDIAHQRLLELMNGA